MLSKAQISLITSLKHKKLRQQHRLFIVEGNKSVQEFIASNYRISSIYATDEASAKLGKIPQNIKLINLSRQDFSKISNLTSPQGSLALVEPPDPHAFDVHQLRGKISLLLDDVQDPGNLGTIIRTAEWFGIKHIVCSKGTVDVYNPKVVQATMGSLARVHVNYVDLEEWMTHIDLPVYAALLEGKSIYDTHFSPEGLILLGNEGNGIRNTLRNKIQHAVTIPKVGNAESLNVAIAATIFCSEVTRQRLITKNG